MKKNYIYIDESGNIDDNNPIFLIGCVITDTPEHELNTIKEVKRDILTKQFFVRHREKFLKQGFHACENHIDIRNKFLETLSSMNFRAYFVILNKFTSFFEKLKIYKTKYEIYDFLLHKLLFNRLQKRLFDFNILIFEQNLDIPGIGNLERRKIEINKIIKKINIKINHNNLRPKKLRYEIILSTKEDEILAITDYMNYILYKLFNSVFPNQEQFQYIRENYKLIEPKIGSIYDISYNKYIKIRNANLLAYLEDYNTDSL